jgi:hypothetical protein
VDSEILKVANSSGEEINLSFDKLSPLLDDTDSTMKETLLKVKSSGCANTVNSLNKLIAAFHEPENKIIITYQSVSVRSAVPAYLVLLGRGSALVLRVGRQSLSQHDCLSHNQLVVVMVWKMINLLLQKPSTGSPSQPSLTTCWSPHGGHTELTDTLSEAVQEDDKVLGHRRLGDDREVAEDTLKRHELQYQGGHSRHCDRQLWCEERKPAGLQGHPH